MKRIRYLSLLLMLLCGITAGAQNDDEFNPTDPAEPGRIPYKLILTASPEIGGSVYGAGKYVPGTRVQVRAANKANHRFVNWTDEDGQVVSTDNPYEFTKGEQTERLTANFVYDPDSPAEPTEIAQAVRYWLTLAAEEGGNVSGQGRYKADTQVTVSAYANVRYDFVGWYDANDPDVLLSADASFTLTTEAAARTLLAKFDYNPPSPDEPQEIKEPHKLRLWTAEGGTVTADSYRMAEGQTTTIRAYANSGYDFEGWYLDGELLTKLPETVFTMGASSVSVEARFTFNPDDPDEPGMPDAKKYAFYLMNIVGKPGDVIRFPVYLTSLTDTKDISFQLNYPSVLAPELQTVGLSAKAQGYSVAYADVEPVVADGESAEGLSSYRFSLTGGQTAAGNTALLTFDIKIPETMATGQTYGVTINQVSVENLDGTVQTASTRNGRISVYKLGDTNGDNVVNVLDVTNMVSRVLDFETDKFIEEVSDINEDGTINTLDVTGVVTIVLE